VATTAREAQAAGPAGTGGAAAQQETTAVAQQAAATKDLTGAMGAAAEKKAVFRREGRMLASLILSEINPALGATFHVASAVVRGIGAMSGAMLGLVGAAAALGTLVAIFQQIAQSAERAAARIREAIEAEQRFEAAAAQERAKGVQERIEIESTLGPLGLTGRSAELQRRGAQLAGQLRIPVELGISTAVAEAVAAERRQAFDLATFAAGLIAGGGKPLGLADKPGEMAVQIARMLEAGRRAGGAEALERYHAATAGAARPFLPTPEMRREQPSPLDVAAAAFAEQHPEISADDLRKIVEYVRIPPSVQARAFLRWLGLARPGAVPIATPEQALGPQLAPAVEEIRYRQAREEYWREERERAAREARQAPAPTSQPVSVHNVNTTVNIDSVYMHQPEWHRALRISEELAAGEGIE
jgi:hypothetical protein